MPWRTAGSGSLSPRRLEQVRRDVEVLTAYRHGATYDELAQRFGYANRSGPYKAIQRLTAQCGPADGDFAARLEYGRLEALHAPLWTELFDPATTARRQNQLITRLLRIADYQITLLDATDGLARPARRRRAGPLGEWTPGLQQRLDGATFDDLAALFGVSHRSVARRRLQRELDDYLAGVVGGYRDVHLERLDAMQHAVWDDATTAPVELTAVDQVLSVIKRRIRLLALDTAPQPRTAQGRRGRRPPPAPGPHSAIVLYEAMDPAERAQIDALLAEARSTASM